MGKFRHVKQVACNAGHNLPHLCIAVKTVRQLLQMAECVGSHIRLDSGPHNMTCISHIKVGQTVYYPEPEIQKADGDNRFYSQICQIIHAFICNISQNQRKHNFAQCRKCRAEQIKQRAFQYLK